MTSTTLTETTIPKKRLDFLTKWISKIPSTSTSFLIEQKIDGFDKDTLRFIKKYKKTFDSLAKK